MTFLSGMDEIGYVVSGLNPEGYLLLDRVVPSPHPLFDSYHLGHPMVVWTEKGALPGVLAIPSVHILSRERRQELQQFSLDGSDQIPISLLKAQASNGSIESEEETQS